MTPEGKVLAAAKTAVRSAGGLALRLSFRAGVSTGWPDLACFLPGGRLLMMECKRPGGRAAPLQLHIMETLRDLGFACVICDTSDSARRAIASAMGARAVDDASSQPPDRAARRRALP